MKSISKLLMVALLFVGSMAAHAQVKVGNNPTTINPNSMLEIESTNKGMLLPRVALTGTANVAPMAAHVAGMTVYNTATAGDVTPGYYYNDGAKWVRLADTATDNHLGVSNQVIPAATNRNITLTDRRTTKINIAPAGEEASISALNVIGGGEGGGITSGITVASNYTDATNKHGIISTPQYLNASPSVQAFWMQNTATANNLAIGGAQSGSLASPTQIEFRVDTDADLTNVANGNSYIAMTIRDSVISMIGKGGNSTTGGEPRSIATRLPGKTIYDAAAENTFGRIASGLDFNWYSDKWTIGATRGSGADIDAFVFAKDSVEMLNIDANGNVGIGTTAPSSKLQVVGLTVHANNAAAITAGLTAGAFYHNGDGVVRVVF